VSDDRFGARPFTRRQALAAGISPGRLRGPRYRSLFHGVYVRADVPDSLELRCDALRLVLPPTAVFSHRTAAALYGLPVDPGAELHVTVPDGTPLPDHSGVRAHQGLGSGDVRLWRSRPLTAPARTWLDLAGTLGLVDLVCAGDALLRRIARPDDLACAVSTTGRRPGVVRARRALPLLRERVDSPMETRLRLIIVMSGLPCPEVNVDLVDETAWQARPDLSYPAHRIAIEYDGDLHRGKAQWRGDVLRDDVYDELGWALLKFTAHDVYRSPQRIIERVHRKLVEAGAEVPPFAGLRRVTLADIDCR
jgi:hypothetical protein